jgi:hypothetical protein
LLTDEHVRATARARRPHLDHLSANAIDHATDVEVINIPRKAGTSRTKETRTPDGRSSIYLGGDGR